MRLFLHYRNLNKSCPYLSAHDYWFSLLEEKNLFLKPFLFLIIFIHFLAPLFSAQSLSKSMPSSYEIHTYTTDDGLSQVSVNDIVQDKEGFLWIATQNGLNRFDGTSFQSFDHIDCGTMNCDRYINCLLPTANKIWIGSRSGGVYFFDKKRHQFRSPKNSYGMNIENMLSDNYGNILLTLDTKGLGYIEKSDSSYSVRQLDFFARQNLCTTALFVNEIDGKLWVGTKDGRLFYGQTRPNPDAITFIEYPLSQKLDRIFVIHLSRNGDIYLGTRTHLFIQSQITGELSIVDFKKDNSLGVIYDIKENEGHLWIGSGEGLYEYDPIKKQSIHAFTHSNKDLSSISNNVIYSILLDTLGQIWCGTGKYLNLLYQNKFFNKIESGLGRKTSLNSNVVFSILKSGSDLWIGTSGGGINLLREQQAYYFNKQNRTLSSNICFSMIEDEDRIWAGTKEGLVIIKNIEANHKAIKSIKIFHNSNRDSSLSNNFIRYIYKDWNKNIWLCTSGGGLERFTGNVRQNYFRFIHYRSIQNVENCIASDKVNYILQTKTYEYWIATDKGLSIMTFSDKDLQQATFSRLHIQDSTLFDKGVIYTLLKDQSGGIWIGTNHGLYLWEKQKISHYGMESGLPDHVIYALLEDRNENIWISTNKGITFFDKKTKSFSSYHQKDGLCSEEYNLHAKYIDKDGILYFGGIDGITYFNPDNIDHMQSEGVLYIDNIQLRNIEKNKIEILYPDKMQSITIKQKQFPISIHFSEINLNYFKSANYAYRLLPENKHWNTLYDKRQIQFVNLSQGNYSLEIQKTGKDGRLHKASILRLKINIKPLWWQSKIAFWLYFLFFSLVIYITFKFLLRRKTEHQEHLKLKEINHLKSRLYANITHEFRTPLTVIEGMTDEIKNKLTKAELQVLGEPLQMIKRNSNKLLHLVKQMLDMSKIEEGKMEINWIQGDIVSYLQYVLESFQSMTESKMIKLVFYQETDVITMDYDPDMLSKIASNLLSNAIKFTPLGGKIIFHIKKENNSLIIKIQDSGIGIEEKHLSHIFDRFYQIDNSMTRKSDGTGIGLALTKELVELHKGTISVKSTLNKGTEFLIKIPITNKADTQKGTIKALITAEKENLTPQLTPPKRIEKNKIKNLPLALIIEDNIDVAKYISYCLSGKYQLQMASDGQMGIEQAIETIPDIIISDVMMPKKDGFEVCEKLKQDIRTSHIPIILLTAKATAEDRIEGLSHGADAYLIKPFNKEELFIRIEQLIKIRQLLQQKYRNIATSIKKIENPTGEDLFLNKVIEIIEKNINDEHLDATLLAKEVFMSESQLYRKIKALSGKSVSLFIRYFRLTTAQNLLLSSSLNISEIAYQCGFNDPAWFSRIFKKEFGISPSQFKKENTE